MARSERLLTHCKCMVSLKICLRVHCNILTSQAKCRRLSFGPTVRTCSSLVAATSFDRAVHASLSAGEISSSVRPSASEDGAERLLDARYWVMILVFSDIALASSVSRVAAIATDVFSYI